MTGPVQPGGFCGECRDEKSGLFPVAGTGQRAIDWTVPLLQYASCRLGVPFLFIWFRTPPAHAARYMPLAGFVADTGCPGHGKNSRIYIGYIAVKPAMLPVQERR